MTCLSRPNTASCAHPTKLAELRAGLWQRTMSLLGELMDIRDRFLEKHLTRLAQGAEGCPDFLAEYRQLNAMLLDVVRIALNVLEHQEHDQE